MCVIAVVRRGLENRREIEGIYAQVDEIVKVLDNSDQISPLISVVGRLRAPFVEMAGLGTDKDRKSVGKDLVENRVANPVGRVGIGHRQLRGAGNFPLCKGGLSAIPLNW